MSFHTVGDAKDEISGLLTGTNLNNVTDLNGALERAARTVVQRADVPEASEKQNVTLYDGVFDYAAPNTIFGSTIVDLRPQGVSRTPYDIPYKKPIVLFDSTKNYLPNGYAITFEYDNGTPIMRVASPKPTPQITLDPMTATTGWVAAGSASGLTLDNSVYYQSPASLRFTLTGSSVGTLTKTITGVNLTSYQGVGVAFLALKIPSSVLATVLSSVVLRIGSSATAYYEVSASQAFLGAFSVGNYTLIALDLSTATTTGSPTITAMTYVQIRLTHTATIVNMYVGGLWISLPFPHELIYQTAAIFMAAGSNPSQSITDDNDTVILNDAAYNIFLHECGVAVAFQQGGTLSSGVIAKLNQDLHGVRARNGAMIQEGLYDMYRADNPSQELRSVSNYYND